MHDQFRMLCDDSLHRRDHLSVVVAYEDELTGRMAKKAFDTVVNGLEPSQSYDCHLWRFDLLQQSQVSQLAFEDAVAADMIIIASHGSDDLPDGVKRWIEGWAPLKKNENGGGRLVALLDSMPERREVSPASCYLEEIAERSGLDFVSKRGELSQETLEAESERRRAFSLLQDNLFKGASARGWGINE